MLLNCGVGEDSWESLGLQEIKPVHPKGDQSWIFIRRTDAKLKLKLQYFGHLMRRADSLKIWCWERLKAGGQGDDRGQDGWMVSLTQWIWVWTSSGRWWRTGKPGVLQSMGHKELNMTEQLNNNSKHLNISPALVFHNCTTQFLYFQLLLLSLN